LDRLAELMDCLRNSHDVDKWCLFRVEVQNTPIGALECVGAARYCPTT